MAKVRLVAFRRTFASSPTVFTSSEETTFELDLNEFPNISVNYQFSDIKNPETISQFKYYMWCFIKDSKTKSNILSQ